MWISGYNCGGNWCPFTKSFFGVLSWNYKFIVLLDLHEDIKEQVANVNILAVKDVPVEWNGVAQVINFPLKSWFGLFLFFKRAVWDELGTCRSPSPSFCSFFALICPLFSPYFPLVFHIISTCFPSISSCFTPIFTLFFFFTPYSHWLSLISP